MTKSVAQLIREARGKFFKVSFIKRTNGERREMVARLGVRKNLTGKGLAFEPREKGLMVAFDIGKKEYRMIPLDGLLSFKCGNVAWGEAARS